MQESFFADRVEGKKRLENKGLCEIFKVMSLLFCALWVKLDLKNFFVCLELWKSAFACQQFQRKKNMNIFIIFTHSAAELL